MIRILRKFGASHRVGLSSRKWNVIGNCRGCSNNVQDAVRQLQPDDKLHGYTVNKVVEIPEFSLTTVALKHDKTGAQHLHLARNDDNNTFSVLFRTTPMDNTGVPHILEHTTLCGSKQFPVRDPFFKMLNRSLATFMNAMTASDWTLYPFSTQNKTDFENLMSVYLDAVFFPQLRELDFCQEGWRLEHENPQDPNSPLVFKGVVYNEMKGVFSSSQNIFMQAVQNKLIPDHTYGVVSGGDPAYITDLTWKQLKEFHSTHYHPSNAKFITYGNFPLEDHLGYINTNYLEKFDQIQVDTAVPAQPRWTKPKTEHITCQPDPMAPDPEKQTTISVNFLLSDITDIFEAITLKIISNLLTEGETSPFYQSLIESNLGSDFAPVTGYDGNTKEGVFCIGLQGIHPNDIDKVKDIIFKTFDQVIKEGFDQKRIDAVLHMIELGLKHQSSNFGLNLSMSIASLWNHDGDPTESLKINELVEKFKQTLKDNPKYLQDKVREYFKENQHFLTLTMSPDEKFEENRKQEETTRLNKLIQSLSEEDRKVIYSRGEELLQTQMATEDLSCLPTLQLHELNSKIKEEVTDSIQEDNVPIMFSMQPTNEVNYVRMISNLSTLSPELKSYVPLFCDIITKMGAGSLGYKELSQEIDLHTGGLNVKSHISSHHTQDNVYEQGVFFSSYCLDSNVDKMLDLWTQIFNTPTLNEHHRLMTLIKMSAAEMAASITHAGHQYAMTHAAASICSASHLHEQFDGVTQVSMMKSLAEGDIGSEVKALEYLKEIANHLLNKNNLRISVNATPEKMGETLKSVESFVRGLSGEMKSSEIMTTDNHFTPVQTQTHLEFPFSVNFMGKAIKTVPYTHEDFPSLRVIARILWAKYLHREIREKGGAYGSGAVCGNGLFSYFSYRDPNSLKTLEVFEKSVDWLLENQFTNEDIDEAKLAVFQQTDKPVAPGNMGQTLFLNGIDDFMRQTMRDKLFHVNREEILASAEKYLVPGKQISAVSFLGPENEQIKENKDWKVIKS
ncbi:hypothetical protein KUTeg_023073 [Tegillarca granosa]|uniref:Peptidase M16C associated domain-containing protein n=1 Tax=Tegillarca granosa TaxID=220873 RepID=A0ABQ9E0N2_TEGGR|nr:hypothetical protein KUTeg_023073 [Tegillarca granosa]